MYNKNSDNACTVLKMRSKMRWKVNATNRIHEHDCIGAVSGFIRKYLPAASTNFITKKYVLSHSKLNTVRHFYKQTSYKNNHWYFVCVCLCARVCVAAHRRTMPICNILILKLVVYTVPFKRVIEIRSAIYQRRRLQAHVSTVKYGQILRVYLMHFLKNAHKGYFTILKI
jgi:hypothetical protein